jgi:hypothetical protein
VLAEAYIDIVDPYTETSYKYVYGVMAMNKFHLEISNSYRQRRRGARIGEVAHTPPSKSVSSFWQGADAYKKSDDR